MINCDENIVYITKRKLDIEFNKNCLQHGLLPNYTNVKLHDEEARQEKFVLTSDNALSKDKLTTYRMK